MTGSCYVKRQVGTCLPDAKRHDAKRYFGLKR